jgi:glycosyltransferase involved in cell wall biosynthesis
MKISIILPVYNEKENLTLLLDEIKKSLSLRPCEKEIIFVDDGSTDGSTEIIKEMCEKDKNVKAIIFKKNFGQTAAMSAGIDASTGGVLIPMDADLQNDPADIWAMIDKLNEGYGLVSGWRRDRHDKLITRKLPSLLANKLISKVTGVKLNDHGCTIKAYKREFIEDVKLYGEMHRFIPVYVKQQGGSVIEMAVNHRPRKFGKSKYGIGRISRVLLDLLVVKFLHDYQTKPMHFFGGAGMVSLLLSSISFLGALFLKFIGYASLTRTPLLLISVFLFMVGLQLILMGLLAEMIMRNYFESKNKPTYLIKESINTQTN